MAEIIDTNRFVYPLIIERDFGVTHSALKTMLYEGKLFEGIHTRIDGGKRVWHWGNIQRYMAGKRDYEDYTA